MNALHGWWWGKGHTGEQEIQQQGPVLTRMLAGFGPASPTLDFWSPIHKMRTLTFPVISVKRFEQLGRTGL